MPTRSRRAARPHRRFEGLVLSSEGKDARARIRRALARAGAVGWQVAPLAPGAPFFVATPPGGQRVGTARAWDLVYRLREDRDIARAEPAFETAGIDGEVDARATRGRTFLSGGGRNTHPKESDPHDWVIRKCRIDEAWQLAKGKGVRIAHPDTGYCDHPGLAFPPVRPKLGYDFFDDVPDPRDPLTKGEGHGTATASVIVSATQSGVIGAAPEAELVPLRVDDDVVHWSWLELSRALYWAAAGGMPIASMSLGGPWSGATLEDAVEHARKHGIIMVAAAGNKVGFVVYPARLPAVIAVAASTVFDAPWADTCRGPAVDITAPGASVWRARSRPPGVFDVARSDGTSYATATTAAVCALWLAHHGGFAALARTYGIEGVAGVFKEALLATARAPKGWDRATMGAGIVDARALLERVPPSHAPARGVRASGQHPAAQTPWERIAAYFPDAEPDRVRGKVRALLRPGGRRPLREADLAPFADEIVFQVATDPALRAAIAARLHPKRGVKRAAARPMPWSGVSRGLARAVAG